MPAMSAEERANVATVYGFMRALNESKTPEAVAAFVADDMQSHNPQVKGKAGMTGFATYLANKHPNAAVTQWIHVYAKGDLVVQHYMYAHDGKTADMKIVDFFRVRDGKIIEYWDVLQSLQAPKT